MCNNLRNLNQKEEKCKHIETDLESERRERFTFGDKLQIMNTYKYFIITKITENRT